MNHRPWPRPSTRHSMAMAWHDLLFLHWPLRPDVLRPFIPAGLELDTYDGWAWIGIVPFRMSGVRPRLVPPVRAFSDFPEINVRTYAKSPGRSGVWFFSLDATNRFAVRAARAWFGLPYFDARITCGNDGETVRYSSLRTHRGAAPATFEADYRPTGPVYRAESGSLEHWLTERYCLYSVDRRGRVGFGDIDHPPWPLQSAEAEVRQNTMLDQINLPIPSEPPMLHFARDLVVQAWSVAPV